MLHIHNATSAKKAARSLEKFTAALGFELKHGQALDALAAMSGFQNWAALTDTLSAASLDARLSPVALTHIEDNQDVTYGPECAVVAHNGFELRYAQDGDLLDYVRICDPLGREIAYWVSDEWRDDPQVVMGAILGALVQGNPATPGKQAKPVLAGTPAAAAPTPTIMDLYPFDSVSHVVIDGVSYGVEILEDEAAQALEGTAGDPDEEDDANHVVLYLGRDDDGLQVDYRLTVAALRALRWSAKEGGFVDAQGTLFEFYLETKFGATRLPSTLSVVQAPAGHNSTASTPLAEKSIELYEVFRADKASGHRCSTDDARVAAMSSTEALELFEKDAALLTSRLTDLKDNERWCAVRVSKDAYGPFAIQVDGGHYARCEVLSHGIDALDLVVGAATDVATLTDSHGVTIAVRRADTPA